MTPKIPGSPFHIDVVSDEAAFADLQPEWDALAETQGDRSIFQFHGWIHRAWQRHRGLPRRRLHIVTIRDAGELVLVAPFVKLVDWYGTSVIAFLDSLTPQYNDILVTTDARSGLAYECFRQHLGKSSLVRALKLNGVRADARIAPLLDAAGGRQTWSTVAKFRDLSAISDGSSFFDQLSAKSRYNFRRYVRHLEKRGSMRFRRFRTPAEIKAPVQWIFERKREWMRSQPGLSDWLLADGTAEFFEDMAMTEAARGRAEVTAIELDGLLISAILTFRCGGTLFASKLAYDPAWGKASPGWLTTTRIMMDACDEGIRTFDMMIGSDEWKERFHGKSVLVGNYRVSPRRIRR